MAAGREAEMGRLMEEMTKAGVLLGTVSIQPSSKGVRMNFVGGKHTVTDGPFAESKELIAGYCIAEMESLEAAIEWAPRFANVVGDVEVDIRPLYHFSS